MRANKYARKESNNPRNTCPDGEERMHTPSTKKGTVAYLIEV